MSEELPCKPAHDKCKPHFQIKIDFAINQSCMGSFGRVRKRSGNPCGSLALRPVGRFARMRLLMRTRTERVVRKREAVDALRIARVVIMHEAWMHPEPGSY